MADEVTESVDLWDVLEEAEETVQRWPSWQQQYDADIYYDEDSPAANVLHARLLQSALVCMRVSAAIH
jgi:hypothetical protein